jgi:hypothetical protein
MSQYNIRQSETPECTKIGAFPIVGLSFVPLHGLHPLFLIGPVFLARSVSHCGLAIHILKIS